jgi:hypothetical protein
VAFVAAAIIASISSIKNINLLNLYQFGAVVYNIKRMSKTLNSCESSTLKANCAAIYQTVQ